MKESIKIRENSVGNFNLGDWSKNRDLVFYGIGNRWQADLVYEEELMIFSSEYPPILRFLDKNDSSAEGRIKSFEIEKISFKDNYVNSDIGIGLKQLEDVGYHDIEITSNTKSSFRFQTQSSVKLISKCTIEFEEIAKYTIAKLDTITKQSIREEVELDVNVCIETGIIIELQNEKSIMVKYISDFNLYFAIIGTKDEIVKRNYLYGHLSIAGKRKSIVMNEETTYNIE